MATGLALARIYSFKYEKTISKDMQFFPANPGENAYSRNADNTTATADFSGYFNRETTLRTTQPDTRVGACAAEVGTATS
jgi:hypothetical protein